jgi:hypothetical protein
LVQPVVQFRQPDVFFFGEFPGVYDLNRNRISLYSINPRAGFFNDIMTEPFKMLRQGQLAVSRPSIPVKTAAIANFFYIFLYRFKKAPV